MQTLPAGIDRFVVGNLAADEMMKRRVLLVDDEEGVLQVCEAALRQLAGVEVATESSSRRAIERLAAEGFDLLVSDIRMPEVTGLELLRAARQTDPNLAAIILTGFPSVESAVESMKLGAVDYLVKPFSIEQFQAAVRSQLEGSRLREENRLLRRQMERAYCCGDILGESAVMRKLCEKIQRTCETDFDVLIVGETGTGKELVARAIHKRSKRRQGPFVPVNCGAIPEELMEREFFGHERGAFTGANSRGLGLLEYAHGGTFFLDEINQLPQRLQGKLLRVLQERRLRRVGGTEEIEFDVRIVAASSVSLDEEVRQARFRPDLYHRINVARIEVPPLRERTEDIPLLANRFLDHYSRELGRATAPLGAEVMEVLVNYSWPGNVRELQNVIKRTLAWAREESIRLDDLPEEIVTRAGEKKPVGVGSFFQTREIHLKSFETEYFTKLLRQSGGDVSSAAREAQLPRGTFYRLLKKHALNAADFRPGREVPGPGGSPAR